MSNELRMLLWKDWKLCRVPLLGAVILFIAPYVVAARHLAYTYSTGEDLARELSHVGIICWVLMALIACAVAGNIFACERQDRSSVFLMMFPIRRSRLVTSKAIIVLTCGAVLWILGAAAVAVPACFDAQSRNVAIELVVAALWSEGKDAVGASVGLTLGATGLCWLWSTRLSSSGVSVVAGVACAVAVMVFVGYLADDAGWGAPKVWKWIVVTVGSTGVAAFLGGTICYVLRRRP